MWGGGGGGVRHKNALTRKCAISLASSLVPNLLSPMGHTTSQQMLPTGAT